MYQNYEQNAMNSFQTPFNNEQHYQEPRLSHPNSSMYQNHMNTNLNGFPTSNGQRNAFGGFSHKAPILATDMRCYFDCPEGFKKDYDLRLHIKMKHRDKDEEELRKAFDACEEEVALTSRSASVFQCAICPKRLNDIGAFYDHIRKKHGIQWFEYKDKYGRCEVESAPFECNICGKIVKYIRDSINKHLKKCHNITWVIYLDRIRKMRKGEEPPELPGTEFFECKICNNSMKFSSKREHIKSIHNISELEYIQLSRNENAKNDWKESNPLNSNQPPEPKERRMRDSELEMEKGNKMTSTNNGVNYGSFDQSEFKSSFSIPRLNETSNDDELENVNQAQFTTRNVVKECNLCNESFESIGLYIKHTTSVDHNKFKSSNTFNTSQTSFQTRIEHETTNSYEPFDVNNNNVNNSRDNQVKGLGQPMNVYENAYQPNNRFGTQIPIQTQLDPRYDDPDYECDEEEVIEDTYDDSYCEPFDENGIPLP